MIHAVPFEKRRMMLLPLPDGVVPTVVEDTLTDESVTVVTHPGEPAKPADVVAVESAPTVVFLV